MAAQLLRPGALRLRLGASEGAEAVEQGGLGGLRVNPSIRQAVEVLSPDEILVPAIREADQDEHQALGVEGRPAEEEGEDHGH